eukprot:TRINITY_DN10767_c0_g1_i1.p1 TRINITY_DN10767_c0_g1~~TRINITY_DN10767_c0_g1_i1.p1  ORF type:complete len:508 (-),score=87.62 TRINITY_DN10767_c0_g1_i1:40-1524(-)
MLLNTQRIFLTTNSRKLTLKENNIFKKFYSQPVVYKRKAQSKKVHRKSRRQLKVAFRRDNDKGYYDSDYELRNNWVYASSHLLKIGRPSFDNDVDLFFNGSDMYKSLWNDIDNAQHRVWVQTYILEPDFVGLETIKKLTDAAKRGCQVLFIYDYIGSLKMSDMYFKQLTEAGGVAIAFRSVWKLLKKYEGTSIRKFWYRTHRKIVVIDDNIAYCGGMNISGDYCLTDIGTGRFRDTHSRIKGSAARYLSQVYENSLKVSAKWKYSKILSKDNKFDYKEVIRKNTDTKLRHLVPYTGKTILHVLESEYNYPYIIKNRFRSQASRNKRTIQKALLFAFEQAKKTLYLTTPYFLPPPAITKAIIAASRRGVDVRILTAGRSDWMFVSRASRHIYDYFLRNGVRVYELQTQELHAKGITIDGYYSTIGSYNLDNLSYRFLLEAKVGIIDTELSSKLEKQFLIDLDNSHEETIEKIKNQPFYSKIINHACYLLARTLLG